MKKCIYLVIFNMTNFNVKKKSCIFFKAVDLSMFLVLTQIQRHHWILGFNQVDSSIGYPSDGI
jgi:hypothetical protein